MSPRHLLPVGTDALLIECHDLDDVRSLSAELVRRGVDAVDMIPAALTILLDGLRNPTEVAWCADWVAPATAPHAKLGRVVEVPTTYDGADLDRVAKLWGMTRSEAIRTHCSLQFTVAFCGFSPGFAYCAGLPPELAVPRLSEPRSRLAAGSVAVADCYTAVYPRPSPGGWQILGHTDLPMWRESDAEPATLSPGTQVRFVDA